MDDTYKLPRLYSDNPLVIQAEVLLADAQAHYLHSVMRKSAGDLIRMFTPQDGEFLCEISTLNKKKGTVTVQRQLREAAAAPRQVHLIFSPLSKNRMDFLIEKAVELGVTDIWPTVMERSDVRKINTPRLESQIIEATEQCERLDVPRLHDCVPLDTRLRQWPADVCVDVQWCCERSADTAPLTPIYDTDCAFLVGPAGGFSEAERKQLSALSFIRPISLGQRILRAETASLMCLSFAAQGE